jgi:hypothetical protein
MSLRPAIIAVALLLLGACSCDSVRRQLQFFSRDDDVCLQRPVCGNDDSHGVQRLPLRAERRAGSADQNLLRYLCGDRYDHDVEPGSVRARLRLKYCCHESRADQFNFDLGRLLAHLGVRPW